MTRLFREFQLARFNQLYYQKRAARLRTLNTGANIIAALASSAVLAGLLADGSGFGSILWKILTGIAATSAAIGPVLGLDEKAAQMEKAALGHSILFDRLRRLLSDLKLSDLAESHLAREQELDSVSSALSSLDETPSDKLLAKCWKQALDEFPSEQAWNLV